MFKNTTPLTDAMLAQVKAALDGGNLYIYSGPEPASAATELDMVGSHTELASISAISFDDPVDGVLSKQAGTPWVGAVSFDGAQSSELSLAPTFFRVCSAGDDGRGLGGALSRLQGSVGGPTSAADAKLVTAMLTNDDPGGIVIALFNYWLGSLS